MRYRKDLYAERLLLYSVGGNLPGRKYQETVDVVNRLPSNVLVQYGIQYTTNLKAENDNCCNGGFSCLHHPRIRNDSVGLYCRDTGYKNLPGDIPCIFFSPMTQQNRASFCARHLYDSLVSGLDGN